MNNETADDRVNKLSALKRALIALEEMQSKLDTLENALSEPIAVIGLGCRFPSDVNSPESYWNLLKNQVDAISEVPEQRWKIKDYYNPNPSALGQTNTRWGGFIKDPCLFDPYFFGLSPREASFMDPQQRVFLEVAWQALENAGQVITKLAGSKTSVYVGVSIVDYFLLQLSKLESIDTYSAPGIAHSIISNRLSYLLDFQGPSVSVDTACSSSLVAIHLACQSLRNKECNLAIAGGVNLMLSPATTVALSKTLGMSNAGRCKTFDEKADGIVRGEGCGVIVLKRLSTALEDKDKIAALIVGSAINQDGRTSGLTAPNGISQQKVINQAIKNAKIKPEDVTYIEVHGTATPLGDPIEVEALKATYGKNDTKQCALSAVKTNIGHLEAAAGVAGVIKAVLALQHKAIPGVVHFQKLNPNISLEGSRFFIPTQTIDWQSDSPRLAAVSSFGFGGTNGHVILKEAPINKELNTPSENLELAKKERNYHLLTISAKSEKSLKSLAKLYKDIHGEELANICFTANTKRSHWNQRLAIVSDSLEELNENIDLFIENKSTPQIFAGQVQSRVYPKIGFLFTGQGSQYTQMGQCLYKTESVFKEALDRCAEILVHYLDKPLLDLIFNPDNALLLNETKYTQPALFSLEYALAELWKSWAIEPVAVIGHSLGEYVATTLAGMISLEDAIMLVAERGRLIQSLEQKGAMCAVFADRQTVEEAIKNHDNVSIAAINTPENIVIAGEQKSVAEISETLSLKGITCQTLKVSHAFHSPMMEPILDAFEKIANSIDYKNSKIPFISNLTGQQQNYVTGQYWRRHLRNSVEFAKGIETLAQHCDTFLEVGPHPVLLEMAKRTLPVDKYNYLASLKRGQNDSVIILSSLARLYCNNAPVDWISFDKGYNRTQVSLPNYVWEQEHYWFETAKTPLDSWQTALSAATEQSKQAPIDLSIPDFCYWSKLVDDLVNAYILKALVEIGFYDKPENSYSVTQIIEEFNILAQYSKLLYQWLNRLTKVGLLSKKGELFTPSRITKKIDIDMLLKQTWQAWPSISGTMQFLQKAGEQLSKILLGKISAPDILFPDGSLELAESIYQNSPISVYLNNIVKTIIQQQSNTNNKTKILEIGAGVGATTNYILPILSSKTEYYFSDISEVFLVKAKQKFKSYPYVRYCLLDIEKDPLTQGFEPHSLDIIVATNVLHATSDLRKVVNNAKKLLAKGGLLIVVEITENHPSLDITFGLFEGWHLYQDDLRVDNPLLSTQSWANLLEKEGFEKVAIFPQPYLKTSVLGQHVIVSQYCEESYQTTNYQITSSFIEITELRDKETTKDLTLKLHEIEEVKDFTYPENKEELINYLRNQVSQVMGIPLKKLVNNLQLKELGIDSLMAIELRNKLKLAFDTSNLTISTISENSINTIVDILLEQFFNPENKQPISALSISNKSDTEGAVRESPANKFLILSSNSPQAKLRLFCFHHAGASVAVFHPWMNKFPDTVEICSVQLPGRAGVKTEKPITRLSLLAEELAKDISKKLDLPFVFFGHSMGALVSFELIRELRKNNLPLPKHLFVSARCSPQIPDMNPPIHMLPDDLFMEELQKYAGMANEVLQSQEMIELFLPVLRADFTLIETYVYETQEKLSCPITVFGGYNDKTVNQKELEAWQEQTSDKFKLHMIEGEHFFLYSNESLVPNLIKETIEEMFDK